MLEWILWILVGFGAFIMCAVTVLFFMSVGYPYIDPNDEGGW